MHTANLTSKMSNTSVTFHNEKIYMPRGDCAKSYSEKIYMQRKHYQKTLTSTMTYSEKQPKF